MFQFSIYIRHCSSRENKNVHVKRVKKLMPEKGNVGIIVITDKQFGMMEIFEGKRKADGFLNLINWRCFEVDPPNKEEGGLTFLFKTALTLLRLHTFGESK